MAFYLNFYIIFMSALPDFVIKYSMVSMNTILKRRKFTM